MKPMNFSVSEQNMDVIKILDQAKNKSDYICAAIREKFARDNSEIAANMTEAQREKLRIEVRQIVLELFGNNACLFGSINGMVIPQPQTADTYLAQRNEIDDAELKNDKKDAKKQDDTNEEEKLDVLASIFEQL